MREGDQDLGGQTHPFEIPSDNMEIQQQQSPPGTPKPRDWSTFGGATNREILQRATASILITLSVSKQFRTLRDFSQVEIKKNDLRLIKRIGEGAFGLVEKCLYVPQNRNVAVKRLKPAVRKSKADIADMLKEIAVLRKLHNKHIIEFIGCGSWDTTSPATVEETLFLVEEFVDGGTLKHLVSKQMKTDTPLYRMQDALRWMIEMAQGLKYLHQCQPMVIHRDLKLENILLQGTDPSTLTTKIADFGLSALVSPLFAHTAIEDSKPQTRRRRTSIVMAQEWTDNAMNRVTQEKLIAVAGQGDRLSGRTGTLMYMAPEVWLKQPYNDKADVYSFAIISYELLHRYQMISATDGSLEECQVYARRVAQAGWRPPFDQSLPKELQSILERCWAPEPELRPNMSDVVLSLQDIMKNVDWSLIDGGNPGSKSEKAAPKSGSNHASDGKSDSPPAAGCSCAVM